MIEVQDFCKTFSSHSKNPFSVQNVSFTVNKGDICALVGPNGSGKSTVMKAICGFHYPSKGKIYIDSGFEDQKNRIDITEEPHTAMELCGYVPEILQLPPDMKVIDFLNYAAKAHNLPAEKTKLRIEQLVKDFFMSEYLDKKIKILSKGQQQRVSFAQALIHNPPNLILDEPVTGLDPAQIIKLRNYIKDLSKNKAILVSTHILSEVTSLCNKAFIMYRGKIFAVQNIENIEWEFLQITEEKK